MTYIMTAIWIYHPRSGSRVFAEAPASATVLRIERPDHSLLLLGDLVELRYSTAQPGQWWRDAARAAASACVAEGLAIAAWDEQGIVCLAAHPYNAARIDALMARIAAPPNYRAGWQPQPSDRQLNLARALRAGHACFRKGTAPDADDALDYLLGDTPFGDRIVWRWGEVGPEWPADKVSLLLLADDGEIRQHIRIPRGSIIAGGVEQPAPQEEIAA